MHGRRVGFAAAALSLIFAASAQAASPRTTLPGTAAPGQAGTTRVSDATSSQTIPIAVVLPLRDQSGLRAFIAGVSDPSSSLYGHYLTPNQFKASYGPTDTQVTAVESYLRSAGIDVSGVSANNTVINATGTVAQAQQAFGTRIGRYHDPRLGRDYIANDSAVTVPSSVAGDMLSVVGLDTHFTRSHPPLPQANPLAGGGPAGGYTPAQLRTGYDIDALETAGNNGTGQRVGLFELAGFKQSNVSSYDSQYGLVSPTPAVTNVDGGNSTLGNAEVEVELDIEVVQAIAPKANITVFEGPNSDQGVIDTYNAIATSNTTMANSTSWGLCEASSAAATITSEDQIFQQMAAQGQSLYAASGDSGAYDCGIQGQLGVDNPADDPYVTGAGGTRLTLNASNGYSSETPWDTNATEGGGGGVSTKFARPSWQTGNNVPTACTQRCVPDISADADPATGYSIFTQGSWTVVGGTSAAAPLWAGFTAVYNEDAAASGKARLGYANPTLYSLASTTQSFPPFHDITTGHTSTATNWPATVGYDLATGIGSFDANNFARDLIGGSAPPNDFSIAASPSSVTAAQGASTNTTISTAVTSGSAQSVTLSASGLPSGATAAFAPASLTAGSGSTLTLTAGASTPAGSYTVTVTGTGTSATHSTTVTFAVTASAPTNNFSIAASPSSVTAAQGASTNTTISTAVTSGSAQSVALSATGLPSGATAAFAPASLTAGSSSTLTLTAGASTPAGSYTVTVTGTGTSATHSTTVTFAVTASGGGGTPVQLVSNGGFESGTSPWSLTAGVLNNSTSERARSGSWDAWLDGYGRTHTDAATQSVKVPAGKTTATLSFWLHIDTAETTTSVAYDKFTVKLGSTTVATFSNLNKVSGYVLHTYNLSGLTPGATYTLSFSGTEDVSLQTSFVLDDVSLLS